MTRRLPSWVRHQFAPGNAVDLARNAEHHSPEWVVDCSLWIDRARTSAG